MLYGGLTGRMRLLMTSNQMTAVGKRQCAATCTRASVVSQLRAWRT